MFKNATEELASKGIYAYGSPEIRKFEKQMERYFAREYKRWEGNHKNPETYGVSSFEGGIAAVDTKIESIEACYDRDMKLYRQFLDRDFLAYTTGYYNATEDKDVDDISCSDAQRNKYELLINRVGLEDGHNVLDLGCGFGGLSRYILSKFPNVTITGINPSPVQTTYIRNELMAGENDFDENRFTLINKYLEDVTEEELPGKSFDRVIMVGMFEHVTNIDEVYRHVARVIKPGGKCISHYIVSKDTIPQFLDAGDTLIGHYFPGGHIWPITEGARHNTHLKFVENWFINGKNYFQTLEDWHRQFWEGIDELYPSVVNAEEVEDWNKYFVLCKAMFPPENGTKYGVGQFLYEARE